MVFIFGGDSEIPRMRNMFEWEKRIIYQNDFNLIAFWWALIVYHQAINLSFQRTIYQTGWKRFGKSSEVAVFKGYTGKNDRTIWPAHCTQNLISSSIFHRFIFAAMRYALSRRLNGWFISCSENNPISKSERDFFGNWQCQQIKNAIHRREEKKETKSAQTMHKIDSHCTP